MKKLVLSVFTLAFAISTNAQNCVSGYAPTVIFNEFSTTKDPGDLSGGLYLWGPQTVGESVDDPAFKSAFTRDSVESVLKVLVTQAAGKYSPFGVGFGEVSAGVPNTVDLTADGTFEIVVSNKSTTTDIRFRMAAQDVNNVNADTKASGKIDTAAIYNHIIEVAVPMGTSKTLSGTYTGAGQAIYKAGNKKEFIDVDVSKIKTILFTVINVLVDGSYQPLAITDVPVEIDYVRVGKCTRVVAGINEAATYANSSLYPNPTSDVTNVTLDLNEVANVKIALTDMFGKQVKVVAEGRYSSINEKVNVSDLAKGVYTVNYMVNGAAVKNKLLLVK